MGRIRYEEVQFTDSDALTKLDLPLMVDEVQKLFGKYGEDGHKLVSLVVYATYLEPNQHVRERRYAEETKGLALNEPEDD